MTTLCSNRVAREVVVRVLMVHPSDHNRSILHGRNVNTHIHIHTSVQCIHPPTPEFFFNALLNVTKCKCRTGDIGQVPRLVVSLSLGSLRYVHLCKLPIPSLGSDTLRFCIFAYFGMTFRSILWKCRRQRFLFWMGELVLSFTYLSVLCVETNQLSCLHGYLLICSTTNCRRRRRRRRCCLW